MRERWKLKEYTGTGRFNIIDDWNHQFIESLPREEAIAKYGECEVWCHYTSGTSDIPDADGKTPSWETDVWVIIPGMKIGVSNSDNLHLRFIGTNDEATFIGKKSGQLITVKRYGRDDYSAWWRDESDRDNETAGYSVRGTAEQIIKELEGEWHD